MPLMRLLILTISIILWGMRTPAQTLTVEQSELFQIKANMEEAVVKKYRDRISTQVPAELFNVGAQVTVEIKKEFIDLPLPLQLYAQVHEHAQARAAAAAAAVAANAAAQAVAQIPSPLKDPNAPNTVPSDLPSDLTLGLLASIINEEEQATQNQIAPTPVPLITPVPVAPLNLPKKLSKDSVRVAKVEVFVGLSSKVGEQYKEAFQKWLTANVQSEFGPIGSATLTDMIQVPVEEEKPPMPEPPRQLNWEERFGNFQNLLGLIVFAVIFAVSFLISKFIPSRDTKEQVAAAIRIEEMKIEAAASAEPKKLAPGKSEQDGAAKKTETGLSANLVFDHYRDHQKKIAFIALSTSDLLEKALDLWLEEGEEGRQKLASVIDCILTAIGSAKFATDGVEDIAKSWTMPERLRNDKILPGVFRAFASHSLEEKGAILEKAYWDLLSMKTLGDKTMKQRFAGISQLAPAKIQKVLSTQNAKVRSVAIMHLPAEKMSQVVAALTFEEKKTVVNQVFENPLIKETELDVVDQSLNFLVKKEAAQEDGVVNFTGMVPSVLMAMTAFEELQLVREITAKRPESANQLKQTYPSIAFLDQWPSDRLKPVLAKSKVPELLALLQVVPDMTETVLALLPPRTKTILQGDIGRKVMDSDELNVNLEEMRLRLHEMTSQGDIILAKVFPANTSVENQSVRAA